MSFAFYLFLATYNPGQIMWQKAKKSSKIGQDQTILISAFCVTFDCNYQTLISAEEAGH